MPRCIIALCTCKRSDSPRFDPGNYSFKYLREEQLYNRGIEPVILVVTHTWEKQWASQRADMYLAEYPDVKVLHHTEKNRGGMKDFATSAIRDEFKYTDDLGLLMDDDISRLEAINGTHTTLASWIQVNSIRMKECTRRVAVVPISRSTAWLRDSSSQMKDLLRFDRFTKASGGLFMFAANFDLCWDPELHTQDDKDILLRESNHQLLKSPSRQRGPRHKIPFVINDRFVQAITYSPRRTSDMEKDSEWQREHCILVQRYGKKLMDQGSWKIKNGTARSWKHAAGCICFEES